MAKKTSIKIDMGSLKAHLELLDKRYADVELAAKRASKKIGEVMHDEVSMNLSSKKHSLEDLSTMDNPYARRHGEVKSTRLGMKPYEIHDRTGALKKALRVDHRFTGELLSSKVQFDMNGADYIKDVLQGTRVMLGRDVISGTMNQQSTRDRVEKELLSHLNQWARTMGRLKWE